MDIGATANMTNNQNMDQDKLVECVPVYKSKCTPIYDSSITTTPTHAHIHSDVCGPMQVTSVGGAKYLLTFIDDHTRKTFGFFLILPKSKWGIRLKFCELTMSLEYCNNQLRSCLQKEGIIHQTSVPYCPQQNGVSQYE